jgi:hypothetical protein
VSDNGLGGTLQKPDSRVYKETARVKRLCSKEAFECNLQMEVLHYLDGILFRGGLSDGKRKGQCCMASTDCSLGQADQRRE